MQRAAMRRDLGVDATVAALFFKQVIPAHLLKGERERQNKALQPLCFPYSSNVFLNNTFPLIHEHDAFRVPACRCVCQVWVHFIKMSQA